MLDAYVIEEIRRRERQVDDRPAVEIPLPGPPPEPPPGEPEDDSADRGVVIIDYG